MITCFQITLSGFPIILERSEKGKYWVNYGKEEIGCDTYEEAARQLGLCIMHALQCDGKLDM